MICEVCKKEFTLGNRKRFCSPECYHAYHRTYTKKYNKEKYLARKKKKHACMMCGEMKVNAKYMICKDCKNGEVYQSYGYQQICSIHS
jgi:hypothetical protein